MKSKEILSGSSSSTEASGFGSLLWARTRTFRVYQDTPEPVNHDTAIEFVGVERGDEHPDDDFCFAHTVAISPVDGSGGAVDVAWKYVSNQFGVADDGGGDGQTPETGIVSLSIGQTLHTVWRDGAIIPSSGNIGGMIGSSDIGGTAIDIRGTGATRMHLSINISVTIETPFLPDLGVIKSLAGRRNAGGFLGSSTGYIMYRGVSGLSRNRQGIWTAVHNFDWDEHRHLRQFPSRDFDNRVKIGNSESGYEHKAHEVFWFQPFVDTGHFGNLGLGVIL